MSGGRPSEDIGRPPAVRAEAGQSAAKNQHYPPSNNSSSHKPTARNTPMLSFQPHHTDISTVHPSVSGRIFLHIPKLAGKKFHFVSLALHLRLKEAISWTRQDLDTFESEKQSWAQTVWDKKVQLSFEDCQVEEGDDSFAVVKEPKTGGRLVDVAADEWRWEWLVPVTEHEVRPESFEGSMGTVWYELEAKCLFRWDELGPDGTVESIHPSTQSLDLAMNSRKNSGYGLDRVQSGSTLLLKGLEGSTSKAKSLAHAFGKLRMSSKSKKIQHAGDFKVANQHEEFIKNSLKMRSEQAEAYASATTGRSTPAHDDHHNQAPEPLPFLIRKLLKLYFIKPPPNTIEPGPSVPGSFCLPAPSMSLPTLPATRRLKAIIPGARIQVQIQIPSLIPIPGYAQTSMLVPDPKKGGLVLAKGHASLQQNIHSFHQHHLQNHHLGQGQEPDSKYLENFHVALTVRKVTRRDINKNDALRKRIEGAAAVTGGASISSFAVDSGHPTMPSSGATPRNRLLSSNMSDSSLDPGVNPTTFNSCLAGDKGCRKEIRVRKVKCEFWQKETCRIPTSNHSAEGQTRTVKYSLGAAFSYSEKDQEKGSRAHRSSLHLASPQRTPLHQLSGGAVSWDAAVAGNGFGAVSTSVPATQAASVKGDSIGEPLRKDNISTLTSTLSPTLKASEIQGSQYQTPSSTLVASVVPARSEPKDPIASLTSSTPILTSSSPVVSQHQRHPHQQPVTQHQPSRPFILLIPVPLDSPKLRQSFTWPSAEILASVPSPLSHEPVASAMPTSLSSHSAGAGAGSGRSRDVTKDLSGMPGMGAFGTAVGPPSASSCDSIVEPFGDTPHQRHHHHPRGSVVPGVPGVTNARAPASGNVVPFTGYSLSAQRPHHGLYAGAPVKTRMEVKHYLTFRLSIDILEFEGEQERDEDHDLEAMEEEQLQAVKSRQTLIAYGHSHNGSDHTATTTVGSSTASSPSAKYSKPTSHTSNVGNDFDKSKIGGTTARISLKAIGSSHVLLPSALDATSSPSGIQQPTPGFLNSTVGLLDMSDSDFEKRDLGDHVEVSRRSPHLQQQHSRARSSSQGAFTHSQYSRPPRSNSGSTLSTSPPHTSLIGAFYDNEQYRGSTASLGTVLSSRSGHSSSPSGHLNMKPGAFVAGALGALKKKASSSGLGAVVSSIAGGTRGAQDATQAYTTGTSVPILSSHLHELPHAHRSNAATVRKLKDFVIRVPITVVVRVDDVSNIGTYYKVDGSESMTMTESNQEDHEEYDDVAKGEHVGQEVPSAALGTAAFPRQRRGSDAATIQTIEDTGDAESEVDGDEEIVQGQFLS
ncbi:hypothetical protein BGZ93_003761 [Podila epicladia]|nr:hypothetical protein BGZ92_002885 [Podila epicladia]KAG0096940.1 hypothetical protein BGZ93_003761 [Podila epicladia]